MLIEIRFHVGLDIKRAYRLWNRTSILYVHLLLICYDSSWREAFRVICSLWHTSCVCCHVVEDVEDVLYDYNTQLFRLFGSAAFVYRVSLWKVNCQLGNRVWAVTKHIL
jgi:hypothetical protein